MGGRRGPGRRSVAHAPWAAARGGGIGTSVLLACACGAASPPSGQGRDGPADRQPEAPAAAAEAPALATVRRGLEGVRSALDRDATVQAGRLLFTTLRSLEDEVDSEDTPIDMEAALDFEEIRRVSDRWQAGATPSRGEARRVLGRLDLEATRLISASTHSGARR